MSLPIGPELRPGNTPHGFGPRANAPAPVTANQVDGLVDYEGAYLVTRKNIDPVQLQEDLIRRLGQDVTITMRMPSDTEPGYLRVLDVRNGLDLPVDQAVIDEVLEENARPETNAQRFLREFDSAPTQAGKLLALRNYVARDVADEEHHDEGSRRLHAQVARIYAVQATQAKAINPLTGELITAQAL